MDKDDKQSDIYGGSKGIIGGDMGGPPMDEEEKFNANVNIEMDEQRAKVKLVKKQHEMEILKAADRIAKA